MKKRRLPLDGFGDHPGKHQAWIAAVGKSNASRCEQAEIVEAAVAGEFTVARLRVGQGGRDDEP